MLKITVSVNLPSGHPTPREAWASDVCGILKDIFPPVELDVWYLDKRPVNSVVDKITLTKDSCMAETA